MRIYDHNSAGSVTSGSGDVGRARQTEETGRSGQVERTDSRGGANGDRVEISGLASRLSGILQAESPERSARLEQLSQQVASGRYRVDPAAVSHNLVAETLSATERPQ